MLVELLLGQWQYWERVLSQLSNYKYTRGVGFFHPDLCKGREVFLRLEFSSAAQK